MEGNSPVLTMADLESVSLLRRDEGWYCAVDSFGAMVVFQLVRNMETGALMANTVATIANAGQLPVPEGEVFDGEKPWESPNRTNIEATRYFATPPAFLRKVFPVFAEQEPIMVWGARGGQNYAGKATQDTVWVRAAPFDITTCSVDETLMVEFELPNLGETENWRALSDLDADDEHMYFTAAFDAEEDGLGFAFQSLVGRTNLIEEAEIIAAYEGGVKLEGLMVAPALLDKDIKSRSLLIASDDEGLGSLIGALNIDDVAPDVLFRDFGNILSRRYPELSTKRLGASGLAELAFVEAASPNLGLILPMN